MCWGCEWEWNGEDDEARRKWGRRSMLVAMVVCDEFMRDKVQGLLYCIRLYNFEFRNNVFGGWVKVHTSSLYKWITCIKSIVVQVQCTPSESKHLSSLTFFTTFIIRLIQKIMQVSSIFFVRCFTIVGTSNLTYPFTYLQ
jgi:hypothetical protein